MKKQINWACLIALCAVLVLPAMASAQVHSLPWDDGMTLSTNDPAGTYKEAPIPFFNNDDVNVTVDFSTSGNGSARWDIEVSMTSDTRFTRYMYDNRLITDFDESSEYEQGASDDHFSIEHSDHSGSTCYGTMTVDIVSN